jgi:hypothetical protein
LRSEVTNNVDNKENCAFGGLHGKVRSTLVALNWVVMCSLDQEIEDSSWGSECAACRICGESKNQDDDQ